MAAYGTCGKFTFELRSTAEGERERLMTLPGQWRRLRVYPCALCHGWHVGAKRK